jgi:hypothetical protein
MTDADRKDSVDPVVARGSGLELGSSAEIIAGRVNYLALLYPNQDIGWAVAAHSDSLKGECYIGAAALSVRHVTLTRLQSMTAAGHTK